MKLLASILALAIIGSISAVPVPPSSVNPCTTEALNNLLYFHPSLSSEPREFIECNPWGGMMLRMCPEGSVWDRMLIDCVFANRTVMNTTFNIEEAMLNDTMLNETMLMSTPFCSYVGNYTCQNNGICSQLEDGFRCMCLSGFSGDYCERVEKESLGVFGIMINSSFSFELYKMNRALFNMSSLSNMSTEFDLTFNGSTLIDEATHAKIASYMARYKNGTMRFDTLVNFFIEDFLSIIFPDAFMMREFYLEPEIKMGFSNAIPRLLMITKYTYDNFEHLLSIFDDILIRLSDYLVAQQASVKEEAAEFFEVYNALNARLDKLYNISDSSLNQNSTMEMGKLSMRELFLQVLRAELNSTLIASYELFRGLVDLQNEISRRQQFGEITMEQIGWEISNFTVLPETVTLINEFITRSNKIWDILSYYGFSSVLQRMVPVRVMPTAGALVGIETSQVADQVMAAAMIADEERIVEGRESEPVDEDDEKVDEKTEVKRTASVDEDEDEEIAPQAMLSSNETMPAALMAENSTVLRSVEVANASALMAENSTFVTPAALLAENSTVLRSVEVANASALMAENATFVTPAAQLAEITTTMTSTVATPAPLVAEAPIQTAQLIAENAPTTPIVVPTAREILETAQELTVTRN